MSIDYADLAASAREILEELGAPVTLTRRSGTPRRTSGDTSTQTANNSYTPNGVFLPYNERQIDGRRIQAGDQIVYLDDTVEPEMDDLITKDGEQWTVVMVKRFAPGTVHLMYSCQVRR